MYDVAIIGSGPAGLTAAIYTARAKLATVVFEGPQPGGQLTTTTDVENYPGFIEGIQGPDLVDNMRKQAMRFETECLQEVVKELKHKDDRFIIECESGKQFESLSVILASGAVARLLPDVDTKRLSGFGVSSCATCDAFFFKGQDVAVVGGGDSAVEEALFLTKFAKKVTLIHRRDSLRAEKILQNRLFDNDKITVRFDNQVVDVNREDINAETLQHIHIKNVKTAEEEMLSVTGMFIAIGHDPAVHFIQNSEQKFKELLRKNSYIETYKGRATTNIPGVFACGDVVDDIYRQAVTAAGSGCMASLEAIGYLDKVKNGS